MRRQESVRLDVNDAPITVRLAGDRERPALLLIHGFPSSSDSFRDVMDALAEECFVIAPDLPGFGASEPIADPTFTRFAYVLQEVLRQLTVDSFHLYLHDYGAAVGLALATRTPHAVRSLTIQNANAHASGLGPQWAATKAYWEDPSPQREAAATSHLSAEGTRAQYVGGVPEDIARRIDPHRWEEDFRIMSLPRRLETQRALVLDYRNHVARFGEIADYLTQWQPPALMLWGRHDAFFEVDETLDWMKALPRMEAHVLDGPHFLLETHAPECAALIRAFIRRVEDTRAVP
jgi:pimeloyl-ACP methyl ester carboxylesterase